jgi:hypothetical protein
VGIKKGFADIVSWNQLKFCSVMVLKNQLDDFVSRLVVVYDSPSEDSKLEFIRESHMVMGEWQGPTMVEGDFNLVRDKTENSNGVICFNHVNMFNWINCWGLMEIKDPCKTFTWSNNKDMPILVL